MAKAPIEESLDLDGELPDVDVPDTDHGDDAKKGPRSPEDREKEVILAKATAKKLGLPDSIALNVANAIKGKMVPTRVMRYPTGTKKGSVRANTVVYTFAAGAETSKGIRSNLNIAFGFYKPAPREEKDRVKLAF